MRILLALSGTCGLSAQQYTISTFAGGRSANLES